MSDTMAFWLVWWGAVGGCVLMAACSWLAGKWLAYRDRKWAERRLVALWPRRPRIHTRRWE